MLKREAGSDAPELTIARHSRSPLERFAQARSGPLLMIDVMCSPFQGKGGSVFTSFAIYNICVQHGK